MHQILLIRHGRAEDRDLFYLRTHSADNERPLTDDGIRRLRRGVIGLRRITAIDTLITSPLVRARQTADLIAEGFPETRRFEWDELAPGGEPEALCGQLLNHRIDSGVTALVGHEPDLGELGGWLLTGDRCCDFMPLKKGSALLLELAEEKPGPGCAILRWLFTPAQLRMLGSACG